MTVQALIHPAKPEHLKGILFIERSTPGSPRWTEAIYSRYIHQSEESLQRKLLLVAISESRVKGFAAASLVGNEAELESIAVAASTRRSGVGTALLAALKTWAAGYGAETLLLEVRASNRIALAFYIAYGFQLAGTRSEYYKNPLEDAILLKLDVARKCPAEL